ncbi:hypothetical protein OH491_10505 [Termitidicoccus mucosus]|uniref:Uncharacterized protein n=1 Tax=Termitidicoccus mucosus TaxID=1184151 RepID=A0A178IFX7_9BACT|nr:hypothetical protein AW736_16850 [Opitutaceae bacterium TSB47]
MTTETASALETRYLPKGRRLGSVHREILHYINSGETALFRFLRGYLNAASLWTSRDDNEEYLDATHTIEDIAIASLVSAWAECSQFCRECATDLTHLDDERNGHDFWLTRNHHGSYWDEPVNDELAEFAMQQLTRASESYGEVDLHIGDDRKLHFSNERSFI